MKRALLVLTLLTLCSKISYCQIDAGANITAIGLGATSTSTDYKFTYQSNSVAHYGLGWYNDPDASAYGPMAYLSGYGGIKFFTGGAPKFTINANGNIGIGTTMPIAKLEINDNNSTGTLAYFGANGTTNANGLYLSRPFVNTNPVNIQGTLFNVGAANISLQAEGGNVGIGTVSPGAKLDVENVLTGAHTTDASILKLVDGYNAGANGQFFQIIGAGDGVNYSSMNLISNYGYLSLGARADGASTATNFLNILSNGAVGIGTTSPGSLLTLSSDNITDLTLNRAASKYARIIFSTAGTKKWYMGMDNDPTPNAETFIIEDPTTVRFAINSSGNVGIGTTTIPTGYKLAVAGNSIAESMTVKLQANWPDVVFKKDYALMPLSEVKTYIDKNQHLPEIPAAAEVEKDGVNLGEMNRLLVKKVEELTLYLIELNKTVKEQQTEIDQLKKQKAKE